MKSDFTSEVSQGQPEGLPATLPWLRRAWLLTEKMFATLHPPRGAKSQEQDYCPPR